MTDRELTKLTHKNGFSSSCGLIGPIVSTSSQLISNITQTHFPGTGGGNIVSPCHRVAARLWQIKVIMSIRTQQHNINVLIRFFIFNENTNMSPATCPTCGHHLITSSAHWGTGRVHCYTGHHCTVMVQADVSDIKTVTSMARNTFIGKEIDGWDLPKLTIIYCN